MAQLSIPGAFLAALLFAVHPVNVESVAWIAQRKNTLAMVFFLLSILWYSKEEEKQGKQGEEQRRGIPGVWYWLSLAAFVLAMLSKGSVAVLPVVLLLLVWWQRGRIGVWDAVRTSPFFVVAIALTGVNVWFQKHGLDVVVRDVNFAQRLAGAGAVVWFYLAKALVPFHLVFIYPQWNVAADAPAWWLPLAAAVVVTLLLARSLLRPTTQVRRALLFAWVAFCVALVPVMGFTDVGFMQYSLVADHYQHIAIIAVVALVAAAWWMWRSRSRGTMRHVATASAFGLVGLLAVLTWQQSRLYANAIDLYEDTVTNSPGCWVAHNNLGTTLLDADRPGDALPHVQAALRLNPKSAAVHFNMGYALDSAGRLPEAVQEFQQALSLKSDFPQAHNNLGNTLKRMGKLPEAIEQYRQAVALQPDYAKARNNLGNVLMNAGQADEAVVQLQEAMRIAPQLPEVRNNLGLALANAGRPTKAFEQFREAIRLKPDYAEAWSNLGYALGAAGRNAEAIEADQQALRLNSKLPEAHYNLAKALANSGRIGEAISQYQEVVQLKPDNADAWNDLGNALFNSGKIPAAIEKYQQALHINPEHVDAYNGLGAALLAAGRPQEALQQYEKALRLKPDYAAISNNLAAAYVQLNRPADAIAAAEHGIELARAQGQTALAEQLENWLKTYRATQGGAAGSKPTMQTAPKTP